MKRIVSLLLIVSMLVIAIPVFAISGEGTESNPYLVATPQDVINIHNDLSGYYKLTADIDMSGIDFEPIGNESEGAFTGTIDGDGHTISNLTIEDYKYCGFVGYMDGGEVKNLKIDNANIVGCTYVNGYTGGIVAYVNSGKIDNCDINDNISGNYYVGGITSYINNGEITRCNSFANITDGDCVGGIVGYSNTDAIIDGCTNTGNINGFNSGGILGNGKAIITNSTNKGTITGTGSGGIACHFGGEISNCSNRGKINASGGAGGIICGTTNYKENSIISNCVNTGNVSSSDGSAGGIACSSSGGVTLLKCYNSGNIISNDESAAGIIAEIYKYKSLVGNCINVGSVNASYRAGGVACLIDHAEGTQIRNCFNSGSIMGGYSSGLVFQDHFSGVKITDCYFSGRLDAGSSGKIIGAYMDYAPRTSLNNCVSSGYNSGYGSSGIKDFFQLLELGNSNYSLSKEEFKSKEKFDGLDFNNMWYIDSNTNSGFPQLRNMPRNIQLNESLKIFEVRDSDKLIAYLDGTMENVIWSSDDEAIATVTADGIVTAKSIGACTVTATNYEGMKANCLIYVYGRAESMALNKSETSLAIGSTETLTYTQMPSTANENVTWHSGDETIATVSQTGLITAKKSGKTTISAITVTSEVVASCEVTVTGKPITSLSISPSSTTVNVNDTKQLSLSIYPSDYQGTITWSSTDENVVTVDSNGLITAKYPGMAYIYAKSESGVVAQCTVTVKAPSTEIQLNKSELTLQKGYTEKLLPTMLPEYSTDTISWTSSNSSYVSVSSDGIVTAKAVGQAIITATTASGKKAYCTVYVVSPSVPVSSVTLDKTELIMTKADLAQLKATVLPSNATNQNLTWASSNESVATVNSTGVVTAVDTGVAIISATANNGVYHECVIKVISASDSSVILSDAKTSPDGTVQVKVNIVKNPGISGYKFTVKYDESLLTPVKVTNNSDFGGSITTNLADSNRTGLNIVWHANEDVNLNGELFTIDFKVSDSAEYGDSSSVSVEYGAKDICNTAGEYFALYIDGATISIEEPLPGDIYEDNEVTIYDLTLLSRYITSLETFTERQIEAADVNDDGDVTVLDVIKVAQHLAGWSNVELMSVGLFSLRESAAPVISVGSASVNSANETEIPVYIKNNTGIAAYRFVLDYNEDDIEILSITPSGLIDKDAFNTNLGAESQAEDGLIVTSRTSGGNMTEDGVLFTIKVRYKNPTDTSVSPISIVDNLNNIGNQDATYVTANYETGYVLGDDYIVSNKVVGNTNFSCELYFDDSYEEQNAMAIIAFYDTDNRFVQLGSSDIVVKPGKVDLSIDYEKKAYATYKLMIWEGMGNLRPITDVK